ncbi:YaeQ family protein, partial [Listeria seeligeri]|uniref:YaeQ family protein n=1 Tax=Listeria seeligeri TaxID=1640 RepID=UPI0022EA6F97
SETDERLMVRLLAFALNAGDRLEFGRGLSTDDEPDLWEHDYTGDILQWIDLGHPDESRIRKACNRSRQVQVVNYGGNASEIWWTKQGKAWRVSTTCRWSTSTVPSSSSGASRSSA